MCFKVFTMAQIEERGRIYNIFCDILNIHTMNKMLIKLNRLNLYVKDNCSF